MVTENEAYDMVCCSTNTVKRSCIGSRCMGWRWSKNSRHPEFIKNGNSIAVFECDRPKFVPASYIWQSWDDKQGLPAGWCEPEAEFAARRTGYCGLGGSPV